MTSRHPRHAPADTAKAVALLSEKFPDVSVIVHRYEVGGVVVKVTAEVEQQTKEPKQ